VKVDRIQNTQLPTYC